MGLVNFIIDQMHKSEASDLIAKQRSGEITPQEALLQYAQNTGDMTLANTVAQQQRKASALEQLASQGSNIGSVPWSSSVQSSELGQNAPQQSNLAKYLTLADSIGMKPEHAVDLMKLEASKASSQGGVVGQLMDRIKKDNPKMGDLEALFTVQTGLRQGMQLDPEGNVSPMRGMPEARGSINYGAEAGKQKALVEAEAPKAIAKETGKAQGEASALLESNISKLPELEKTVEELSQLGKSATYTYTGRARDAISRELGFSMPKPAIAKAEYKAKVDNQILPLLRDTFGAQFTAREGDDLKKTLGDDSLAPEEKDAVLNAFIKQKKSTIESLQRQTGLTKQPTGKEITQADIQATAMKSGKSVQEVIKAAQSKGYIIK